jgi:hypothetical protein
MRDQSIAPASLPSLERPPSTQRQSPIAKEPSPISDTYHSMAAQNPVGQSSITKMSPTTRHSPLQNGSPSFGSKVSPKSNTVTSPSLQQPSPKKLEGLSKNSPVGPQRVTGASPVLAGGDKQLHAMKPPRPPSPAKAATPQPQPVKDLPVVPVEQPPTIVEPKGAVTDQDLILTSSVSFHKQTSPSHPKPQSKTSPIIPKQSPTPSTTSISKMNGSPQLLVTPQFEPEKPLSPKRVEKVATDSVPETGNVSEPIPESVTHDPFAQIPHQDFGSHQTDAWNWQEADVQNNDVGWQHEPIAQEDIQLAHQGDYASGTYQYHGDEQYQEQKHSYEYQQGEQNYSQYYTEPQQYPNEYPEPAYGEETQQYYTEGYQLDQQNNQEQNFQYHPDHYPEKQQQFYPDQYAGQEQLQFDANAAAYYPNYSESAQPVSNEGPVSNTQEYTGQQYQTSPVRHSVPAEMDIGYPAQEQAPNGNGQWNQESTELDAYTYRNQEYPEQSGNDNSMPTGEHAEAYAHEEHYTEQTFVDYNAQNYEHYEGHQQNFYQEENQQWQYQEEYQEQYQESYHQPLRDESQSLGQAHGFYSTETLLSRNSAANSDVFQPYKFCLNCSKQFDLDSNFCGKCGSSLQLIEQAAKELPNEDFSAYDYQHSANQNHYDYADEPAQEFATQAYEEPHTDTAPHLGDPLGRDRGHCVFTFGFGGQMISSFPKRQNLYQGSELIEKCYPGPLRFQEAMKCIDPNVVQECVDAFGSGPLCTSSKPNAQALLSAIGDLIKKFSNRNEDILLIMNYFKSVLLADKYRDLMIGKPHQTLLRPS